MGLDPGGALWPQERTECDADETALLLAPIGASSLNGRGGMRSNLRRAASLLAVMALALIAATAAVGTNPHTVYTCTKTQDGQTDVETSVPEPAVGGKTSAGYTCVVQAQAEEDEDEGEPAAVSPSPPVMVEAPSESRSLYCSTKGPVERGNSEGAGVALNLADSQGTLLVEKGLATPAIFYAGIGVSCDLLPGFTYAGVWVDHVGAVVPGVAVYPYYVPTTS